MENYKSPNPTQILEEPQVVYQTFEKYFGLLGLKPFAEVFTPIDVLPQEAQEIHALFDEPIYMHRLSRMSYPQSVYRVLKENLNLTNEDYQSLMGHTWASVRNRGSNDLVSNEHSEKLLHNTQVLLKGVEVFGDVPPLNNWLRKFNPFLDARPIDLLGTVTGSEMVLDELIRLQEGSVA